MTVRKWPAMAHRAKLNKRSLLLKLMLWRERGTYPQNLWTT